LLVSIQGCIWALAREALMDWMNELGDVLNRYGDVTPERPPETVQKDFDAFAQNAPPAAVSEGLSAAFRSDRTPEFPRIASQLFGRGSGAPRAALLNTLLATVGPMVLQQILARRQRGGASTPATSGGLGEVLGDTLRGNRAPTVTPEVADQVSPADVEEIAREAEKKDPSVIDRVSEVYARQPELVKVLGGAALAIALGRMAQKRNTL
jgi:hypothetical protein